MAKANSTTTTPSGPGRVVFISYVAEDREFVHRLMEDLQKGARATRFLYDLNLPPGHSFANTLVSEITSSDIVLAILSPDYLASEWSKQELNIAIQRSLEGRLRLIPVLARPCTPQGFVRHLRPADFSHNYQSGLTDLVWGMTGERPSAATGEDPGSTTTVSQSEVDQEKRDVGQAVADFNAAVERTAPAQALPERRAAFVAMPFGDRLLNELYEDTVKPTLENKVKIQCHRGDDVYGANVVMQDILNSILEAKVVIADLSGKNPNVMYEVGLSHASLDFSNASSYRSMKSSATRHLDGASDRVG